MTERIIFAAFDIETSGLDVEKNEILEIAIVPLNNDFSINNDIVPFSAKIKAEFPEQANVQAMEINKLDLSKGEAKAKVAEDIKIWITDNNIKRINPVAHNLQFDLKFFNAKFPELKKYISWHGRDSMSLALIINDLAFLKSGKYIFESVSLQNLKNYFGLDDVQHRAESDAIDSAIIYKKLLEKLSIEP